MIRKFNFTGRQRIKKSHLDITISEHNGQKEFDINFTFDELNLQENAKVYVEPYYRASYMRFDYGQINSLTTPNNRYLTDIPSTKNVQFRIKIVNPSNGKLIAYADKIKPISDETPESRESILWTDYDKDLDQLIWRVSFEADMPTLEINNKLTDARKLVENDNIFRGLVLPAVLERIVAKLTDHINDLEDYEGDMWYNKWVLFIRESLGIDYYPRNPDDESQLEVWIDEVVNSFCRQNHLLSNFIKEHN